MAGFMDFFDTDQARLGMGLLAAAGPRADGAGLGQRLMEGVGSLDQWKQQKEQQKYRDMQYQQAQMQMDDAKRKQQQEQAQRDWRTGLPAVLDQKVYGASDVGPTMAPDTAGLSKYLLSPDSPFADKLLERKLFPREGEGFTLGDGQVRYDSTGQVVAQGPAKAPSMPSGVQEYQFAKEQGYPGTFEQWVIASKKAGASSNTVTYGAPVSGVDANGSPVFFQPSKGGGSPSIIPGVAPAPAPLSANVQGSIAQNNVTLSKIDKAISGIKTYPDALGLKNLMGDSITQRTDPEGVGVRALVADLAGQKIHDRSGAAVTVGESERLKPYVPNVTDTPATAEKKLTMFRSEYQKMNQELQSGATLKQATGGKKDGALDAMPPASQHKGRVIRDTSTGKTLKSDGMIWKEEQ